MKKLISVLLCISVLFSCCAVFGAADTRMCGDIDNDKKITASDARLALRNAVKLEILNEEQLEAADVDLSGKVDASDARMILRGAVKLEDPEYFGMNGSQIFNGGHYSMVAYVPENDTTLTISQTNDSYYVETVLDFAKMLEIDNPDAKPVTVGFLTIDSGLYIVLPSDNMYLLMNSAMGGSMDFTEIFEGLGSLQQGGAHTNPTKVQKNQEFNGKKYTRYVYVNSDKTHVDHLMDGPTLCYILAYDSEYVAGETKDPSSQMQVKSITGTVSAAHRTTEGGKVLDGSKDAAMMMFMLTLVARTGLSLEELGIENK